MSVPRQAVSSFATLQVGRSAVYVVPLRGLVYGAVSLAVVLAILFTVDRALGRLESRGWTSGQLWTRHNKRVEENHRRKTTTNECELRHWHGQPLPSGANRRKILVLGDSFVWGPPYVTLNHLWWRQLAIELQRRGYSDVDVVAAGHPGWSTHRQLECARHLIPEIKPDLVIWGYVTNDPDEKIVRQIFDSQDQPPYGQRIRKKLQWLLPNLSFKFESLRADKLAAQYTGPEYGYAYPDWELKLVEGENFARYQQTVREVGELMRQSGVPTFLLTLPHFPCREYFEPRYAPVLPEWEAVGIAVKNTLPEFIERYGNVSATGPAALSWGINPADSHPGPQATHFYAVKAADFIEQRWPDVFGAKDASQVPELIINDWLPFDLKFRRVDEQTFELDYPGETDLMFRPPGEPPTALVALRYPLPVHEIFLEGPGLMDAKVWISTLDPVEQYDEVQWQEVGKFFGSEGGWFAHFATTEFRNRPVAEIRFSATIKGPDRRLTLSLIRRPSASERR